jgi:hypothetical protein
VAELGSLYGDEWEHQKATGRQETIAKQFNEFQTRYNVPVDLQIMYAYLCEHEYGYGPAFQGLKKQRCSHNREATGEAKLFQLSSEHLDSLTVHPASLNTIFQLGLTAITSGGHMGWPRAFLLAFSLWIFNEGLSWPQQDSVITYATVERTTVSDFSVNGFAASSDGLNKARLWYDRFEITYIASKPLTSILPNSRQFHMSLGFKPALDKMNLPGVKAYLKSSHPQRLGQPSITSIRQKLENMVLDSLRHLVSTELPEHVEPWQKRYWN